MMNEQWKQASEPCQYVIRAPLARICQVLRAAVRARYSAASRTECLVFFERARQRGLGVRLAGRELLADERANVVSDQSAPDVLDGADRSDHQLALRQVRVRGAVAVAGAVASRRRAQRRFERCSWRHLLRLPSSACCACCASCRERGGQRRVRATRRNGFRRRQRPRPEREQTAVGQAQAAADADARRGRTRRSR